MARPSLCPRLAAPSGALVDQLQLLATLRAVQLVVSGREEACRKALQGVESLLKLKVRVASRCPHLCRPRCIWKLRRALSKLHAGWQQGTVPTR